MTSVNSLVVSTAMVETFALAQTILCCFCTNLQALQSVQGSSLNFMCVFVRVHTYVLTHVNDAAHGISSLHHVSAGDLNSGIRFSGKCLPYPSEPFCGHLLISFL